MAQWGNNTNPYRFAGAWGYRNDGDVGLLHVGARYYDPQVGRFISRDPVLSEHPYLYCEHEPVNRVDPSGSQDFALDPKTGRMVWIYDKWQAPPIEWGDWDAGIGIGGGVGVRVDYDIKKKAIKVSIEIGPFTWESEVKVPPRSWPPRPGIGSPYPPVVKSPVPGAPYEIYDPNIHGKGANLLFF